MRLADLEGEAGILKAELTAAAGGGRGNRMFSLQIVAYFCLFFSSAGRWEKWQQEVEAKPTQTVQLH